MSGLPFLNVVDADIVGDLSSKSSPVQCVRISDLCAHELVQDGSSTRVARHIIVVPEVGIGRHVIEMETYEIEPGSIFHIEPGRAHHWVPESAFDGWVIAIDQHVCPAGLFSLGTSSPLVMLGASMDVALSLIHI